MRSPYTISPFLRRALPRTPRPIGIPRYALYIAVQYTVGTVIAIETVTGSAVSPDIGKCVTAIIYK